MCVSLKFCVIALAQKSNQSTLKLIQTFCNLKDFESVPLIERKKKGTPYH